jgi:hypothetical protein
LKDRSFKLDWDRCREDRLKQARGMLSVSDDLRMRAADHAATWLIENAPPPKLSRRQRARERAQQKSAPRP